MRVRRLGGAGVGQIVVYYQVREEELKLSCGRIKNTERLKTRNSREDRKTHPRRRK
jgi:hypothetical protein